MGSLQGVIPKFCNKKRFDMKLTVIFVTLLSITDAKRKGKKGKKQKQGGVESDEIPVDFSTEAVTSTVTPLTSTTTSTTTTTTTTNIGQGRLQFIADAFDALLLYTDNFTGTKKYRRTKKSVNRTEKKLKRAFNANGDIKCKPAKNEGSGGSEGSGEGSGSSGARFDLEQATSNINSLVASVSDFVDEELGHCSRFNNYKNLINKMNSVFLKAASQV